MSDDQMRGLKDLLRSESGQAAPDDTAPMSRPARRGRGLSALATSPSQTPPTGPPPPIDPQLPHEALPPAAVRAPAAPATPDVTAPQPASRPARTQAPTPAGASGEQAATPRRKTSVTLPPAVRDRIADAYHQGRWTLLALLELVGERLTSGEIARSDVEAAVTALADDGGGSASIRSLSVPTDLLQQFDDRSGAWRLSRSALLAACLVLVLDHLPD